MSKRRTLVFLLKDGEVLLAMKKRGFGVGKWNGVGGKKQDSESIKEAALREALEEIEVEIPKNDLKRVGTINFLLPERPDDQGMNCTVYVYSTKKWAGEPKETEEMRPKWFNHTKIPFKDMWWDDQFWLPKVLEGKKFKAIFYFKIDPKTGEAVGDSYKIDTK